ncbi:MAG: nuclear transport factor 2 family protein [Chloracidobacterium sp.]|nr:nuclear transport factor 2 family protein [Chloracidobacterium sp.]
MRKIALLLFILSAAVCFRGQTAPDAVELTQMLNDFLAGAGKNDAAVHDRFWADDLIYTRSAGVRINKEELMKGVRSAPAPKVDDPVTVYTAEDIKIQQYGNAAIVAFRLVINTTKADGTKTVGNNLNTGTFVKRNGKWQAVAWQSTVIPEPKSATLAETKPILSSKPSSPTTAGTRVYQKGPRGGCYYISASGSKVYVDHKYCN